MNLLLKNKKSIFLLSLVLGLSAQVEAQNLRISDIRVEGLQRVSASPVFAALPLQVGDQVDTVAVRTAIRSLFATGFFDDVEVLQDGSVLIVRLKERPTISEITIEGNKAIKTEMLQEAMTENDLAEGQIFQRSMLDTIVNELERQYVAQGRYAAEVTATVSELPNNQVSVKVLVDEGKVAALKHINIVGNQAFNNEELLELFESRTTGWLSWLTNNDRYAREKLRGDIEKLESHYLDRGYLDFEVISTQVSLSPDQKSVYVTLNIKEGDVYTVENINLAGELIVEESSIRRLVLLNEGRTFSQVLMTETSEYITRLMGNAGYTNAEVEGIPEPNPETNTVDVTFLINPGDRVYVRRIGFRGNTRTQDEVLRREMRQMEGSSASNARIEQGKVRLERLGFFKGVEVETSDVPGTSDLVDLEYTVEEQPSGAINASIGYGQVTGVMLGASLQQNNWLGTGKQVGVSVQHSTYQTLYNLSYNDPYFTPDGVSRGITLFYNARDYSKIRVSSYTTDSYGVSLNFGYPISEIQRLNFGAGYTHLEVRTGQHSPQEIQRTPFLDLENQTYFYTTEEAQRNLQQGGGGFIEDFSLSSGMVTQDMLTDTTPGFIDRFGSKFDTFSLKAGWLRSTLNRGIFATRGSRQSLQLEVTVPGSDLEYYTVQYDGQVFKPINDDFTLRFRTSLGYGDGYGDMDRLPFFKNYYAGGYGSIRGFDRSSVGPKSSYPSHYIEVPIEYRAVDQNGDGINDGHVVANRGYLLCDEYVELGEPYPGALPLVGCEAGELARRYQSVDRRYQNFGGNILVEGGAELLFPIPFIEDQRSMQLSLFIDAGNVFDTNCSPSQNSCTDLDIDEIRVSAGISLNWLSAMGPLTFSWGKPLVWDKQQDLRESFQFSLGQPF